MSIFGKKSKLLDFASQSAYSTEPLVQSIWSPSTLQAFIAPNASTSGLPVTVDEAMSIPAVSAAIGIYSGVCSRFPLTASNGADWLSNTQGSVTPQLRIAALVQDVIFHNAAVLFVTRDSDGYVNDAIRVHPNRWSIDHEGSVLIDNKPFDQNSIIFIAGLKPQGFLVSARNSVRHAAALEQTILNRSLTPSPITLIKETQQAVATDEEIDNLMANFEQLRRNENGGNGYVPFGFDVVPYSTADDSGQLLIAARMAARTDLANHLNLSAAMVDGLVGNSDVYSNALQSKSELLELSLKLFTEPIANRLSQPDVVPPGVKVEFDYSSFEITEDAKGNLGTSTEGTINE